MVRVFPRRYHYRRPSSLSIEQSAVALSSTKSGGGTAASPPPLSTVRYVVPNYSIEKHVLDAVYVSFFNYMETTDYDNNEEKNEVKAERRRRKVDDLSQQSPPMLKIPESIEVTSPTNENVTDQNSSVAESSYSALTPSACYTYVRQSSDADFIIDDESSLVSLRKSVVERYGDLLFGHFSSSDNSHHNGGDNSGKWDDTTTIVTMSASGDDYYANHNDTIKALLQLSQPRFVEKTMEALADGILRRWKETVMVLTSPILRRQGDGDDDGDDNTDTGADAGEDDGDVIRIEIVTRVMGNLTVFIEMLGRCGRAYYLNHHLKNLVEVVMNQILLATASSSILPLSLTSRMVREYEECCGHIFEALVKAHPFARVINGDREGRGSLVHVMEALVEVLKGRCDEGDTCSNSSNDNKSRRRRFSSFDSYSEGSSRYDYHCSEGSLKAESHRLVTVICWIVRRIADYFLTIIEEEEEKEGENIYTNPVAWKEDGNYDTLWSIAYKINDVLGEIESRSPFMTVFGLAEARTGWVTIMERAGKCQRLSAPPEVGLGYAKRASYNHPDSSCYALPNAQDHANQLLLTPETQLTVGTSSSALMDTPPIYQQSVTTDWNATARNRAKELRYERSTIDSNVISRNRANNTGGNKSEDYELESDTSMLEGTRIPSNHNSSFNSWRITRLDEESHNSSLSSWRNVSLEEEPPIPSNSGNVSGLSSSQSSWRITRIDSWRSSCPDEELGNNLDTSECQTWNSYENHAPFISVGTIPNNEANTPNNRSSTIVSSILSKGRRRDIAFLVLYIFALAILAMLIAVVAKLCSRPSESPKLPPPSRAPSTFPSTTGFTVELASQIQTSYQVDIEMLLDDNSLCGEALQWITEDPLAMSWMDIATVNGTTDASLLLKQRFFITLFYFHMMGDTWTHCSRTSMSADCTVWDRDGVEMKDRELWLSESHECEWGGIKCLEDGSNFISEIHLNGLRLRGSIPKEIQNLTELREMYLMNNEITGRIPTEIGVLTKLVAIDLRSNYLSHSIPSDLYSLTNLVDLTLSYNNLNGTISSNISNLSSLKVLYVSGNDLTGSIPSEIGLINFDILRISDNHFSGSLPHEFKHMTNLHTLFMDNNAFTGELQLPVSSKLTRLPINNNKFNSTLPDSLYSLTNLHFLDASNNEFTGELNSDISNLSHLQQMKFRKNRLEGTIPKEISRLKDLDILLLHYNNFVGMMPDTICDLNITKFSADCREDLVFNDTAEVSCICCTICCDPTGMCTDI